MRLLASLSALLPAVPLGLPILAAAPLDVRIDMPSPSVLGRFSEKPTVAAVVIGLIILCLAAHEVAHAWVALKCGDTTARDQGRITWNPLAHVDPFMTVLLPAFLLLSGSPFLFGGAKPVPVVMANLRHPWRDMMFVAIAGPLSNLLLGILFLFGWKWAVFHGGYDRYDVLPTVLGASVYFNWILAVFNMLPIPPLDGSRVVAYLLPAGSARIAYASLERFGLLLVVGLLILDRKVATQPGPLSSLLWDALGFLREFGNAVTFGRWIL